MTATARLSPRKSSCGLASGALWCAIALALGCTAALIYAGEPPPEFICGRLSNVDDIRVLHVWGTPGERGYAQGYLLAAEVVKLLNGYLTSGIGGGGVAGYQAVALPMTKLMRIAPEYEAELRGMLRGIEARNGGPVIVPSLGRPLSYEDLVAVNCIPDLPLFGCSSFVVWGPMTADGSPLAGRNLDWRRMDALDGTQIVVAYPARPDDKRLGWVSITWPGYIGCLTGMNADGVTVSMHDVRFVVPTVAGFTPRGLALRDAVESARAASAIEDIAGVLRARTSAVGNNVAVAMPRSGGRAPSAVFEYDGVLSLTNGVTVRLPDQPSYQCCTNHYVQRSAPRPCPRYQTIRERLDALATGGETLDVEGAWEILQEVRRPAEGLAQRLMTCQSVVFEPESLRMHVALSKDGVPAPLGRPITLNVRTLLDEAPTDRPGQ